MLKNKMILFLIINALLATSCQTHAASWVTALRTSCTQWGGFIVNSIKEYKQTSLALTGLVVCACIAHMMAYRVTIKRNNHTKDIRKARQLFKAIEQNKAKVFRSIEEKQDQRAALQKDTQEKEQQLQAAKEALEKAQAAHDQVAEAQQKRNELEQLHKHTQHVETATRACEQEIATLLEHNNPENVIDNYEYWRARSEGPTQAQLDQKYSK